MSKRADREFPNMHLRPLNVKGKGSSFFSAFSWADASVYDFISSEFTCLTLNERDIPSLCFSLGPDGFWLSLQRLPNPCSNFITALSVVVQSGLKNQFLIPTLALNHLFSEHYHWQLLGEGGRENWAIFQNKYGLFVFVFASVLNSDCILCLDTTIIINFPVCSSILTATKTRWWIMLDVVTRWVGGRERKEKTDVSL